MDQPLPMPMESMWGMSQCASPSLRRVMKETMEPA